jgi:hypothetical protein
LNPTILSSLEIAVLKFTRKILLQAADLTEMDFEVLRNEGLNNGDIVRIIAIAAMSLGETVVSRAIEAEPPMPEFAKDFIT